MGGAEPGADPAALDRGASDDRALTGPVDFRPREPTPASFEDYLRFCDEMLDLFGTPPREPPRSWPLVLL